MRVYEDLEKPKRGQPPVSLFRRSLPISTFLLIAILLFIGDQQKRRIPQSPAEHVSAVAFVPGGTFTMGTTGEVITGLVNDCQAHNEVGCALDASQDSTPPVQVQLAPFWIEKTEVSFEQFARFLNTLPAGGKSYLDGCLGHLCI